jgi:hypothetical protein
MEKNETIYTVPFSGQIEIFATDKESHTAVSLGKPRSSDIQKIPPTFYAIRSSVNVFTKARHLPPSSVTLIRSKPFHSIYLRSILILFSHVDLGLPLPSGFYPVSIPLHPHTYRILSSSVSPWFDYPNNIRQGARGSTAGWRTALKAGRLRVRFPMVSLA